MRFPQSLQRHAARFAPASGLAHYELWIGGHVRRYAVHVPKGYEGSRSWPVVLELHGSGSDPVEQLAISGMDTAAERRGFIVVLPIAAVPMPGGGVAWNVPVDARLPDDIRFVGDVLDDVARRLCIDDSRVYVTGFSGGARLASEAACALGDRIAGLGAVGGLRAPRDCGRPLPVIAFHGTADPVNPYDGGGPAYWQYGIGTAVRRWRERNACEAPVIEAVGGGVHEFTFAPCADGADLRLYRIDGMGHVWPGSSMPFPAERFGAMTDAVDATTLMLDFFARHRLDLN